MLAALLPVMALMSLAMAILLPMIMAVIMVMLFTLTFYEMGPAEHSPVGLRVYRLRGFAREHGLRKPLAAAGWADIG